MNVRVRRQQTAASEGYWESFTVDVPGDMSIAGLLDYLNHNDDIVDDQGRHTARIGWECSCMQGVCGACAMVVNGVPALACETFVRDCAGDTITIQPLRKFPVVRDLIVDRSVIPANLQRANAYIGTYQPTEYKTPKQAEQAHELQYIAAKCLKCGLCLEVCPNYTNGANFFGALFANDCYLIASRNRGKAADIRRSYGEHFANSCSKSLSCMDVCPMNIPTIASMARLNRGNV